MKRKLFFLTAFVLFNIGSLYAHALWIETSQTGKKGQKQLVEIFWGEFAENERDSVGKWFSDMRDFKLFVSHPDGTKEQLETTAGVDRYTANFTPAKDGIYVFTIAHDAKDLGGTSKLQYNAVAVTRVGASLEGNSSATNASQLKVFADAANPYKLNKPLSLNFFLHNTAKEKIQVEVASPSGWNRGFNTNDKGNVTFSPIWEGRYMAEGTYYAADESGEHNGKPYKATWRCVTYAFDVKK